jgi:hypothetical protein
MGTFGNTFSNSLGQGGLVLSPSPEWDYEGMMTVGENEEGGYGYEEDWYGSITPELPATLGPYRMLEWISADGIYYSSECCIDIIEINGTEYSGFTNYWDFSYKSHGSPNPFPSVGQTCTIKIKLAEPSPEWDYEGVMTVGGDIDNGYGYIAGAYGSITPSFSEYCGGDIFIYYVGANNNIYSTGNISIIEIDGIEFNVDTNEECGEGTWFTYFVSNSNPFPSIGQTCTIKIKLA